MALEHDHGIGDRPEDATPDFVMEGVARSIARANGVTGPMHFSRPGEEDDEPAFAPEDILYRPTSVWIRQNIVNN